MPIELVMLSNHLIFCLPLLLLPSIFPNIRIFLNELALLIRCLSTGVSASQSVLPMTTQGWFPLGLTGLISLQSKGLSRVFSGTTIWKHQFFSTQLSLQSFSDPLEASSQKSYLHILSPFSSHSLLNSLQVGSKLRFLPLQYNCSLLSVLNSLLIYLLPLWCLLLGSLCRLSFFCFSSFPFLSHSLSLKWFNLVPKVFFYLRYNLYTIKFTPWEYTIQSLFKMWIFLKFFYWICYNISSVLCFGVLVGGAGMWGIFAPLPGIEPTSLALKGKVLTNGLPGKPQSLSIYSQYCTNHHHYNPRTFSSPQKETHIHWQSFSIPYPALAPGNH